MISSERTNGRFSRADVATCDVPLKSEAALDLDLTRTQDSGMNWPLSRRSLLKKSALSIVGAGTSICFAGCGAEAKPPLRIGINIWPGYEIISLAESLGHYRSEGITVDIVEFDSLSDARRALESGKVDAIGTTTIELALINASPEGRTAQAMWVFDYSDGADMIIAPKAIQSIDQLKGKPVGVEVASLGVFLLGRALEISGLRFTDVNPVSTHQLAMPEMLKSGNLAAAVTYPPTSIVLLRTGDYHVLFDSRKVPGEVMDILAVNSEIARNRAEDLAAFCRSLNHAWIYLQTNREDAIARMARRERMSPKEFDEILSEGIKLISPNEQADFLKKGGQVDTAVSRSVIYLQAMGIIPKPDDSSIGSL